jgi:hypothetical protein
VKQSISFSYKKFSVIMDLLSNYLFDSVDVIKGLFKQNSKEMDKDVPVEKKTVAYGSL